MSNIPRPEHPRPDRMRAEWLNLNGEWEFEIDNGTRTESDFLSGTLNSKITVPFCPESKLSGVGHTDFMTSVWYRRSVFIPREWSGKRIILHIDACDYEAHVYVNGTPVGTHRGGYTPFAFDITDKLREGENALAVHAVDDTASPKQLSGKQSTRRESYGCFYTRTTGIWQTVWLEAVPTAHILSYNTRASVSDVGVSVDVTVNDAAIGKTLTVNALYEGRTVGTATATVSARTTAVYIKLSEKHLWECGQGRLYDLDLTLGEDKMHGYFGLREVALTREGGLMLNGRTVFGRFVLDQGFYPDGIYTAPTDAALIFDIEASMKCGFNGARLHQKVFEPRFLYHADRLGYMVIGEAGNWGLDHTDPMSVYHFMPEWLEELERDRAHPAIVAWTPFNETWDIDGREQSVLLIDAFYSATRAVDPMPPVITNSGSLPTNLSDAHDVHDYEQDPVRFASYYAKMEEGILLDQLARSHPDRQKYRTELPVFVSEYGGIAWVATSDNDAWGYGISVKSEAEYFERLEGLTDVLLSSPRIFAFCYTQLTDVEQEQNGLLTYDRRFKFDPEKYRKIFSKHAAIEIK